MIVIKEPFDALKIKGLVLLNAVALDAVAAPDDAAAPDDVAAPDAVASPEDVAAPDDSAAPGVFTNGSLHIWVWGELYGEVPKTDMVKQTALSSSGVPKSTTLKWNESKFSLVLSSMLSSVFSSVGVYFG